MGSLWNNSDGLDVHFGTRKTGERANFGVTRTSGSEVEIILVLRGSDFTSGSATYNGTTFSLPAGFTVRQVGVEVLEAFNVGGTTPTINIGVSGSVGTNYAIEISEAQAEAVGVYNSTPAGTLAANTPLAAAQTLTVGMDGTSPTITGSGGYLKATIIATDVAGA